MTSDRSRDQVQSRSLEVLHQMHLAVIRGQEIPSRPKRFSETMSADDPAGGVFETRTIVPAWKQKKPVQKL
jgi:hypothetical protein